MQVLGPQAFKGGVPKIENQLVAVYHAEVEEKDQKRIIHNFVSKESVIRCIIASVAFGMVVNIPDIAHIYHWGEPNSPLSYWQQVGRGGRDGGQCRAVLCHNSVCTRMLSDPESKAFFKKLQEDRIVCIRCAVLQKCHLEGMGAVPSPPSTCIATEKCLDCTCAACLCCSNCQARCKCSQ